MTKFCEPYNSGVSAHKQKNKRRLMGDVRRTNPMLSIKGSLETNCRAEDELPFEAQNKTPLLTFVKKGEMR